MSTRRNISLALTRTRHIARVAPALGTAAAVATLAAMAACADQADPTSPAAARGPLAARATSTTTSTTTSSATTSATNGTLSATAAATNATLTTATAFPSGVVTQVTVGDTTVTAFIVGTTGTSADDPTSPAATFMVGHSSKVKFPSAVASICDPATSSYGVGTWDSPCTAAKQPITITAKTWVDASTGKVVSDFQPALRFVPGVKSPVTLYLQDPTYTSADHIWYQGPNGAVNEALADPSLATVYDSGGQWVYRIIKHFSGYIIMTRK